MTLWKVNFPQNRGDLQNREESADFLINDNRTIRQTG